MEPPQASTYPIDIATALRKRWESRDLPPKAIPDHDTVVKLLDTMYQASLLREENAPVQCRILYVTEDSFEAEVADGASSLHVLRFDEPVSYTPHNLRKLAGAAGFYRALLTVSRELSGDLTVWGMVVTGTDWVNDLEGGGSRGVPLPNNLVLQILAPGHIVAASGFTRILEVDSGRLLTDGFDPFYSLWLPQMFGTFRGSLLKDFGHQPDDATDCQICDQFVKDVAQRVVRRVLRLVRLRGHGCRHSGRLPPDA